MGQEGISINKIELLNLKRNWNAWMLEVGTKGNYENGTNGICGMEKQFVQLVLIVNFKLEWMKSLEREGMGSVEMER